MRHPLALVKAIAKVGAKHGEPPDLSAVRIFKDFFRRGHLDHSRLDERNGSCTRRESLARYLFLEAVLDQGPDIGGVRQLLQEVTDHLYDKEVRFLHSPEKFFAEIGVAVDGILDVHEAVKRVRAKRWGSDNNSNPDRYNLFLDGTRQVLNYTVFRWGVPLAVPLLLVKDALVKDALVKDALVKDARGNPSPTALLDYIERDDDEDGWPSSAEMASRKIKDHPRYGLGKAIGDKAAHLYVKWLVYSYGITRLVGQKAWGPYSYEVPFDSNAGRVLFRTGFLFAFAGLRDYEKWEVVQAGKGKGGNHYIRVTNIRGKGTTKNVPDEVRKAYVDLCVYHLKTHSRGPKKIEIQRVPSALLLLDGAYCPGAFDDGLIHIGTTYCFNHEKPKCLKCPIRSLCDAGQGERRLIEDFRT